MPLNNNQVVQKSQSAADRLVKLPIFRSACSQLSVLYTNAKSSHPSLKMLCEVLEKSVMVLSTMASDRISPVFVQLEPHISVANDVACKSLDWLESAFPVLLTPTEEVVACAKDRVQAVQEALSTATKGTMDSVKHVMGRVLQGDDHISHSIVETAIVMASLSLDCALNMSEALIDHMLPPSEDNKEEDPRLVEGFEAKSLGYPTRVVSLTSKFYRRVCEKVLETLPRSSGAALDLQTSWPTLVQNLWMVPQYLQHQAVALLSYILQMYSLNTPQENDSQVRRLVSAFEESPPQKDVSKVLSRDNPDWTVRSRPAPTPALKQGCNVQGCGTR